MTSDNGLRIHNEATTDATTPVNRSKHTYFNLRGEGATATSLITSSRLTRAGTASMTAAWMVEYCKGTLRVAAKAAGAKVR
jgi:galactose mutarotase-like enzyme